MSIKEGESLEYRVANIAFCQGYLSRRRIPVRAVFYPERVDVSDIDVFGVKFDANFNKRIAVWECKSGEEDRTVDRILWLLGLAQYTGAEFRGIVRPKVPDKIKLFANSVGVSAWDYDGLAYLEKVVGANSPIGHNNSGVYYQREIDNYKTIRDIDRLNKAYWFLKGTFWFEPVETRLKRSVTAVTYCQEELGSLKPQISQVARDLLMEGLILVSVAVLDFAGHLASWRASEQLTGRVSQSLTSGLGTDAERREIIGAALEYAQAVKGVKSKKGPSQPLQIPPPGYVEPLVDLIDRLYEHPAVAQDVPRFLDFMAYEAIIPNKVVEKARLGLFFHEDLDLLMKMSKNVVTFLERATGFPKEVIEEGFKL